MTDTDKVFFTLNLLLALVAIPANLWGIGLASRSVRALRMMVVIVASAYAAGYAWVLHTEELVQWARTFRRVSPLLWMCSIIGGPVLATLERRRMVSEVSGQLDAINPAGGAQLGGD